MRDLQSRCRCLARNIKRHVRRQRDTQTDTPSHPRIPFLTYTRPPKTPYITMLALPPQSGTAPCAQARMGPRAHPHCIACYYKQPHICSDSEPTLYSPDNISLSGLKLEDASPVIREIPEAWAEPDPQYKLRPFLQPGHYVESAVSTPRLTSCAAPEPDSSVRPGAPGPQFRSYAFPDPALSAKSEAPRIRRLDAFPDEWPRTWDPHPTIPGLQWMHRRWTDGRCPATDAPRRPAQDNELTPVQEE